MAPPIFATSYQAGLALFLTTKELSMLQTILVIILVLWLLGMITAHTLGGSLHILLVVALVVFILNYLPGRRSR